MTTNAMPAQPRWGEFTEAELTILRHGCAEVMEDIRVGAQRNMIPPDARQDAADTLLVTARMAFEIDDAIGEDHPPLTIFAETSRQIAAGTYHLTFAAMMEGRSEEDVASAARIDDMSWPTHRTEPPVGRVQAVTSPIDRTPRPLGPKDDEVGEAA